MVIERPLDVLYLDLNSYFAAVEQCENPGLRGKPVAVAPLYADTTFVIAASTEAKKHGVKTGTRVADAKRMCPDLQVVSGNHTTYLSYHNRIIDRLETVLPVDKVCSVDEMRFRLLGKEREPEEACEIARQMKRALTSSFGDALTCSIGIAPNSFLAKLGTELKKPDGLVVIESKDLPEKLFGLPLTIFTGINKKTEARLRAHGIFDGTDLSKATQNELRSAFGGVIGERWWHWLRGEGTDWTTKTNQSLGHSHVLSPRFRTDQGCRDVLLRLALKAASRLRKAELWATRVAVGVDGNPAWRAETTIDPTQDTVTVTQEVLRLWEQRRFGNPRSVHVTFFGLLQAGNVTPSLFSDAVELSKMSHAVDRVNAKFGKHSVYLASMERSRNTAPERIAFQKTWLLSEGKGDMEVTPASPEEPPSS